MTYNFTIGGLGFNKFITDEHPYERSTAPFKKEQFDAAPTVGDQSLTGWWARGQLSFHKGEGVKYYEVLEGEEVLNRYESGEGVVVSTPGKVTLAPVFSTIALTDTPRNATSGRSSVGDDGIAFDSLTGAANEYSVVHPSGLTAVETFTSTLTWIDSLATGENVWSLYAGGDHIEYVPDATILWTYTGTASSCAPNLFYGKGRLWAIDDNGRAYSLSTAGGSFADADSFWRPVIGGRSWAFTEGPACVYFADNVAGVIYSVTITDEGAAVPTINPGVQVFRVPTGELLRDIYYYQGHLVIGSTLGVRVAAVDASGALTVGPLMPVFGGGTTSITAGAFAWGNSVFLSGKTPDGVCALVEVDLSQEVASLQFAYSVRAKFPSATSIWGVGTHGNQNGVAPRLFVATDEPALRVNYDEDLTATGTVATGFHRYGTLDPKHFQSVAVRVGGEGGSVSVSRVDADGTVTALGTVTAAQGGGTFPLGLSDPVERVALKFTLTRDAADTTKGPELLGYQLKALPAPARQRLMRIPLMLFDVERGTTGRAAGREGAAWERLAALEALEASDALTTFTDHDTGETGDVMIETVEVSRKAASNSRDRSNGFGGVVTVTLRKLD